MATTANIARRDTIIPALAISGLQTHHQDQVITPVSFRARNRINISVRHPGPVVVWVLLIFLFL